MFGYSREAVRVKVKKCEGKLQPELRKFSVDPQITSLEVLQSILAKAFDIKSDFTISYRSSDDYGHETYVPVLSDWDLDAAFLKAHNISLSQRCEPCVQLRVDTKPFAETSEDWEPSGVPSEQMLSQAQHEQTQDSKQSGFQGLFMNQVEKTFNMVSRALNLYEDATVAPRPPLSDAEFRTFLDPVGQIVHMPRLRDVIYCGGIEPSLRKVVWKHILNVYPDGMTGRQRMDYMKTKAAEYYSLRAIWKDSIQKGQVNAELAYVTSMVRKDVLRTDRHHKFYAGSDDNQNIASLFNILTTYALHHPMVSYCQGMSDLASPLLVTMCDEPHAYICLCALMARLHPNFLLDGEAMTIKFTHLTEALQVYDPEFYGYLKSQQADDLLFCYRWLLLEMKREFAFDDALRMLEVLWASLPQKSPIKELALKERDFDPCIASEDSEASPLSPLIKTPRENAYTKVCSIRRQSSAFSIANSPANTNKLQSCKQMNYSLDENLTRKVTHMKYAKEFQSLDDAVLKLPASTKDKKFECMSTNQENDDREEETKENSILQNGNCKQPTDSKSSSTSILNGQICENESAQEMTPLGSQIRMLRDRISMHNQYFTSLEKLNSTTTEEDGKPKARIIKNLNEFLTLTSGNRSVQPKQEKLMRTQSAVENNVNREHRPSLVLTKTSFDENDFLLQKSSKESRFARKISKLLDSEGNDSSSPDDSEYYPMTTSMTRELRLESEHLDRQVFGPLYVNQPIGTCESPSESASTEDKPTKTNSENQDLKQGAEFSVTIETQTRIEDNSELPKRITEVHSVLPPESKNNEEIFVWENPLIGEECARSKVASGPPTPDEQTELELDCETGEIIDEVSGKKSITPIRLLRKSQPADKHSPAHSGQPNTESQASGAEQGDGVSRSHKFFSSMSQELENARRSCETILNQKQSPNLQSVATTINNFQKKYEMLKPSSKYLNHPDLSGGGDAVKFTVANLPPPHIFGGGNPFLMFLCLTVLLQHRDFIIQNRMDYNELAMHFDKMVRKHNVNRVLNQARQLYSMYLKQQANKISDVST